MMEVEGEKYLTAVCVLGMSNAPGALCRLITTHQIFSEWDGCGGSLLGLLGSFLPHRDFL
jgi:hypothetical protein